MNFDTVIDRRQTFALKWDNCQNQAGLPDVIPLWVADMDFAAPDAVVVALQQRALHPVIGYTNAPAAYFELLADWYRQRYGLSLAVGDFILAPAVMPAIALALRACTVPGDAVIIMPPVYYPFFEIPRANDRRLVEVPLLNPSPGCWEMDFNGIEAAITQAAAGGQPVRALLLSNPHNPGGRVWTKSELAHLDRLACQHDLYLLSDEIHSDIVFEAGRFTSLAAAEFSSPRRLVFAGPNKTFNIAGLHICHIIAPDATLNSTMRRAVAAAGFSQPNAFSLTAAMAAYGSCGPWVDELKTYLLGNFQWLADYVAHKLSGSVPSIPEGTYLAWLDCRALIARLGLRDDKHLVQILEEKGRVKVSAGSLFGKAGQGFVRVNVACPRSLLAEGMERFAATVAQYKP